LTVRDADLIPRDAVPEDASSKCEACPANRPHERDTAAKLTSSLAAEA